ncbi:PAS domain S-box protein [Phormidium sp. LEGE 05292]|uniref:PAS domain S-box protein n=1 Tax=[Phormidium] sp. LEGE 05292 TaxID=767427 RepID=UPI0018802C4D|nr:PAS domain S-box protein [Phormidium sp. LEGE 05292]MBE9228452.1 PAS domain S-box protein [Phormidium sp. LEGE 05292]
MSDRQKTKNQLIAELEQLRAEVAALKQEKTTTPICRSNISGIDDMPEVCPIALSPELGAVYQAINRHPLIVTPDTTIPIVIQKMEQSHFSSVLVIDQELLVGIFTERDLVKLISERIYLDKLTIAEVMTRQLIAISITEIQDAVSVFNLMQEQQIRHLPVLDESGQMFGLITMKSLREALQPSDLLRLRQVKEVLVRQVTYAPPNSSLFQVVRLMAQEKISCVVIAQTDKAEIVLPLGIITERDVVRFHTLELDFYQTQAAMVMSTPLLPISPEDSLLQAYQLMNHHRIRRLVVCDEKGNLVGILTQRNILQAMNPAEAYSVIQILRQEVDRLQNENILLLQNCNQELQRQIKETGVQLAEQMEQERLLAGFTQQINRSLNLPNVLNAKLSCTILLLVPQQSDRILYQNYLSQDEEYNYKILEFASPQAALEQCQQMMPDLLLVDELLPDLTAQEFLIQLGKLVKTNSLPVIVITSSNRTKIIVDLLKSGAQDYLNKSNITSKKLHKTIKVVLEKTQLSQEQPKQQEQEQLVSITALHIRQFLDLNQILAATVNEVRRILGCDRVIIYRFKPDFSGIVVVESVVDPAFSMLGWEIKDDCFREHWIKLYQQGRIRAIDDIYTTTNVNPCHVEFLSSFQVRANLVVPILAGENLWGLIIAHNCTAPRHWKATEIDFLSQLATQVGIGIQQAALVTQLQTELKERREAEVALQESEAHFRNAILNAPMPIMLHAEDGEVLLINQVWTEITGYTKAEIPTVNTWINKAYRKQRNQFQKEIQQLYEQKKRVSQGEYTVTAKTSETRIWNFSSALLGELPDGRRLVISTALDITEQQATQRQRQQAEFQLQESEQRLQLSLEAAKAGSWELNLLTGEFITSDQYKANLGLSPEDEITYRQLIEELIHPHDRAMQQAYMRQALEQHTRYEAEYRCTWSDGSIHWLMARGKAFYQNDGTPYRMIGVTLDITERKKIELELFKLTSELEQRVAQRTAQISQINADLLQEIRDRQRIETALRASEARWRTLVENAPSFVVMIDREGKILFLNRVLPEFSIKSIIGQSFYDYVLPEYQSVQKAAVERVFQSGEATTFEVLGYKDTQGNLAWYETRIAPIWQEGEIAAAIVISNDISDRKNTEAALRKNQDRLIEAQQVAHIGNWDYDLITGKITWTQELFHILNRNPALGEPNYEENLQLYHPEDREKLHQAAQQSITTGESYKLTLRILLPDNSIRYINGIGRVGYNSAGEIIRIYGTAQDITEQIQAEQALRDSEARWRSAFEDAATGMALVAIDGRFLRVNAAFCEFIGYSEAELLATNFQAITHPDDLNLDIDFMQQCLRGESRTYQMEKRYLHKLGYTVWGLLSVSLLRNAQGESLYFTSQIQDITVRKHTEADLKEKNRRWRSLLDNIQLIVIGLDKQGLVEYANPFFLKLTGYTEAEVLRKSWIDKFVPNTRKPEIRRVFQEIIEGADSYSYFLNPILTLAGEERMIAWNNTILHDVQGNAIGSISIGEDITERYKLERMKGEFVSIVSHELRTPLTSMQAALSLLSENIVDPASETGKSVIQIAAEGVEHLVRLVNDILDLERLESGKIRLEKSCCNPAQIVKSAIDQMQEMANQSGIKLSTTIESCPIYADGDRLLQVLINLLSNAIKFSANNSTVSLKIEIIQNSQDTLSSPELQFSIKDQGRGIPADKLETIFERFHQIDASDSREKGGTGLGLAICRSIVQQHGGKIWVESVLGEGSTFYLTLPIGEENCGGN